LKVILILEDNLSNGGAFHQALNAINQFNIIANNNLDYSILYFNKKNKEYLNGNKSFFYKKSFIDKLFIFFCKNDIFLHFITKYKLISPLEKKIKLNEGDIVYFLTQSITPIILQKTPYICTLFDVCHLENQEFPEVREFGIWNYRQIILSDILPKAILTITDSIITSDFISNNYSINQNRIITMPYGTADFKNNLNNTCKNNFNYKYQDYIFYPAQFWPHKNHIRILQSIKYLREEKKIDFKVVFVGSDKSNLKYIENKIKQFNLEDNIIILGFVNNEELADLYRNSKAVVMASYFGSTNIPPLEAFLFNKPLINSILNENQTKDAALYFNPNDYISLADAILRLNDDDIVKIITFNGKKRLTELSSERSIAELEFKNKLINFKKIFENWN
jgi:glycosyltransferase involved in cell wall biosynthesis